MFQRITRFSSTKIKVLLRKRIEVSLTPAPLNEAAEPRKTLPRSRFVLLGYGGDAHVEADQRLNKESSLMADDKKKIDEASLNAPDKRAAETARKIAHAPQDDSSNYGVEGCCVRIVIRMVTR